MSLGGSLPRQQGGGRIVGSSARGARWLVARRREDCWNAPWKRLVIVVRRVSLPVGLCMRHSVCSQISIEIRIGNWHSVALRRSEVFIIVYEVFLASLIIREGGGAKIVV